ncbi:MAG: hypothetical protein U5K37_08530 [Natrialbaceae archaeon]|nr:hypothetical protein [Natrialbaceae archaeon]
MATSLLSVIQIILWFVVAILLSYFAARLYWNADKKAENLDKECKEEIQSNPEFRALQSQAGARIIVSSTSKSSRARAGFHQFVSDWTKRPTELLVVDSLSEDERTKAVIRTNCREIPGKVALPEELIIGLRNYYAYKLALIEFGDNDDVTVHFKNRFEGQEHADRIRRLGNSEFYASISLDGETMQEITPLDDVFLSLLQGVWRHCIQEAEDGERIDVIEVCRAFVLFSFWGLYAGELQGMMIDGEMDRDYYADTCRASIRDDDQLDTGSSQQANVTTRHSINIGGSRGK